MNENKDVRLSYKVWCLLYAKSTELTLKTGKTITIKSLLEELIIEKYGK